MRALFLVLAGLLAGCVPASRPPAPVLPPPLPMLVRPVPLAADWRDWPLSPGDWRYTAGANGGVALFGPADAPFTLRLACERAGRQLRLSITTAPGAPPLTVRTSSTARTLPTLATAHADAWPPVTTDTVLPAADPLLDAMAFSRGRFTIEAPGRPPLVVPAWAEVGRVIEDCRR